MIYVRSRYIFPEIPARATVSKNSILKKKVSESAINYKSWKTNDKIHEIIYIDYLLPCPRVFLIYCNLNYKKNLNVFFFILTIFAFYKNIEHLEFLVNNIQLYVFTIILYIAHCIM